MCVFSVVGFRSLRLKISIIGMFPLNKVFRILQKYFMILTNQPVFHVLNVVACIILLYTLTLLLRPCSQKMDHVEN